MTTVSIGSLALESGKILQDVHLAYEHRGDEDAPAVLVCQALTGDQLAVGSAERPGWWAGLIGPGKSVDTAVFQVITFNVLGGMKALEWGKLYPDFTDTILPLAVTPAYSDYSVAFNHLAIQAIESDAAFNDGNYGDSAEVKGLEPARMTGW